VFVSETGTLDLVNSVLWCNHDAASDSACTTECTGCSEAAQISTDSGTVTIDYSVIQDLTNSYGSGNIDDDPLLSPPTGNESNYVLRLGSPAIDAGDGDETSTDTPADAFDIDDDGLTAEVTPDRSHGQRVRGSVIDMGAYEYCPGDTDADREVCFQDSSQSCRLGIARPARTSTSTATAASDSATCSSCSRTGGIAEVASRLIRRSRSMNASRRRRFPKSRPRASRRI
jgi:hypothetical protein